MNNNMAMGLRLLIGVQHKEMRHGRYNCLGYCYLEFWISRLNLAMCVCVCVGVQHKEMRRQNL